VSVCFVVQCLGYRFWLMGLCFVFGFRVCVHGGWGYVLVLWLWF
jgi:hypothetical protein